MNSTTQSKPNDFDADVAIIGYGPSGMAAAALIAQSGHSVVVLERYPNMYNLPRAAIFDDETMRTLDKLGIAEELLPTLRVQSNYEWVNAEGELLIEHHFSANGRSGWAEWYMMYQPYLEDALDRACRKTGSVDIRHTSPVLAVDQDTDGVTLSVGTALDVVGVDIDVSNPTEPYKLRARYVLACDGGNSSVRRYLGIGEEDLGFSEPWMVCDFAFKRPGVDLPTARQVGDPAQPVSIISLGPDHHRFSFMLDSEEQFATEADPAKVWARVSAYLDPADADLIRVATYTFRSRISDRWREGRVLLVGDSAHSMPPFLGQGMCSGIRDAQNVAFKLDLLLNGSGNDTLLDTYQLEREPHVRVVVEKGIELGRVQALRDPVRAAERDARLLAARAADESPHQLRFPGLARGLLSTNLSAGRGELFVQGDVHDGERRGRFDEIAGRGSVVLLTEGAASQADPDQLALLRQRGIVVTTVSAEASPQVLLDVDGTYARWFADNNATAVAVRPDFYVYGTANDAPSVEALLAEVVQDLTAPQAPTEQRTS